MEKHDLDLDSIYNQIWEHLYQGAEGSKSSFHLASLGTVKDVFPRVRTVVMRKVIGEENSVIFHTDTRSAKYSEIQSNGNVALSFYSKEDKIQIRLEGTASIHEDDDVADMQWQSSKLTSRKCYLANPGPGAESPIPDSGVPAIFDGRVPSEEESEAGRENFCAVKVKVNKIDWLYLSSSGHKRAVFDLNEEDVNAGWVIP